jgi:hypothetical protein
VDEPVDPRKPAKERIFTKQLFKDLWSDLGLYRQIRFVVIVLAVLVGSGFWIHWKVTSPPAPCEDRIFVATNPDDEVAGVDPPWHERIRHLESISFVCTQSKLHNDDLATAGVECTRAKRCGS